MTEMVEFIALPSPFPIELKTWSFHVVIYAGTAKKSTKKGCTCRVAVLLIKPVGFFFYFPVAVAVVVS